MQRASSIVQIMLLWVNASLERFCSMFDTICNGNLARRNCTMLQSKVFSAGGNDLALLAMKHTTLAERLHTNRKQLVFYIRDSKESAAYFVELPEVLILVWLDSAACGF
jgi:hypothetical protein